MKKKLVIFALSLLILSCKEQYPKYSLSVIEYIPDSLKVEHRNFITETIKAASEHMTAGDYEDVDETIIQAERTADRIFMKKTIGLKKILSEETMYKPLYLKSEDFNSYEKKLFDSLNRK